ncbi:MAG: NAD(P)H-hydrate dehydratase [Candidatus Eisenbacteria bacterium]
MRLATSLQMRECDRRTIAGEGLPRPVPGRVLMERAGWGIYAALRQHFGHLAQRAILIFCGPGNNGGDGFVVARHLQGAGFAPEAFLVGREERLSPDAREQYEALRACGARVHVAEGGEVLRTRVRSALRAARDHRPLLLDALLGTGSRGAPRGEIAEAVGLIQDLRRDRAAEVLAIDLPTGIDADSGGVPGDAVTADVTVTMAFLKVGFLFHPARSRVGRVRVADIGIPDRIVEEVGLPLRLMTHEEAAALKPRRAPEAHKTKVGRVRVVGGSPGLTGAPCMAGMAAQRTGSGLITVALPVGLNQAVAAKLTEVMTLPCPETPTGGLSRRAEETLLDWVEKTDVWALGPGLGRDAESIALIRRLAGRFPGPVVIDADGLRAFAGSDIPRREGSPHPVLTPHPGEMMRLLGAEGAAMTDPPYEVAARFAQSRRCVLILKGAPTVVAGPHGDVWVNPTGNSGLATGGSGDVLTGIVASLLGQGLGPLEAARLAVYVHGAAADRLAEQRGLVGASPPDLVSVLPETMPDLSGHPCSGLNAAWKSAAGFPVP